MCRIGGAVCVRAEHGVRSWAQRATAEAPADAARSRDRRRRRHSARQRRRQLRVRLALADRRSVAERRLSRVGQARPAFHKTRYCITRTSITAFDRGSRSDRPLYKLQRSQSLGSAAAVGLGGVTPHASRLSLAADVVTMETYCYGHQSVLVGPHSKLYLCSTHIFCTDLWPWAITLTSSPGELWSWPIHVKKLKSKVSWFER